MSARKRVQVLVGILFLFALGGCATTEHQMREESVATGQGDPRYATEEGFEIGPEDVLEIAVWKEENLKKEVLVRPDGGISFPLVGEIQAAGKTPGRLQSEITQRLTKFIPRPSVNVSVLKTASYKIYVIGKVNKPGEFTIGRRVDVLQALSMAGGLTPFADAQNIRIVRRSRPVQALLRFDYSRVQRGGDLRQNIELRSGDTVVVP